MPPVARPAKRTSFAVRFGVPALDTSDGGKVALIMGKKGSGKSVAVVAMIEANLSNFYAVYACSEVAKTVREFRCIIPPACVKDTFPKKKNLLTNVHDMMQDLTGGSANVPDVLVVLDDCFKGGRSSFGAEMEDVIKRSRNARVSIIVGTQSPMTAPPAIRENADLVMATKTGDDSVIEKFFKLWFKGPFRGDRARFYKAYHRATDNHQVLCFKNYHSAGKLSDSVYVWKVPHFPIDADAIEKGEARPPFRAGHRDFWLLSLTHAKRTTTGVNASRCLQVVEKMYGANVPGMGAASASGSPAAAAADASTASSLGPSSVLEINMLDDDDDAPTDAPVGAAAGQKRGAGAAGVLDLLGAPERPAPKRRHGGEQEAATLIAAP